MCGVEPFERLIGRVRAGDAGAAEELVRQYEPEIRRSVRVRLTDPRLRRLMDSMDICQSVLGNFFLRVAAGQFDLDQPDQLIRLLVTMARNKVRDQARRQHAERRDQRRLEPAGEEVLAGVAAVADSPSQLVAGRELLEAFRERLWCIGRWQPLVKERPVKSRCPATRSWAKWAAAEWAWCTERGS